MSDVDRYLEAATRQNTQRSYASALRHFEVEWGGHLPATPDSVARYLAAYAGQLAVSTLRHRLAALAAWHRDHGFVDPTRSALVRKVLKGIQTLHPAPVKQAEPLQIRRLAELDHWLIGAIDAADLRGDRPAGLRHRRDRALVLLGRDAARIAAVVGPSVAQVNVASIEEAVQRCAELAQPGDAVLLSPACASLDMFKNYEERGRLFAHAVEGLS